MTTPNPHQQQQQQQQEQTIQLQLSATAKPPGTFEILAITAGEGKGWLWDAPVLKDSLALWDGVECFIDHSWYSRSVRDLAGTLSNPTWDEENKGVKLTLKTLGPSGPLLEELGRQVLAEEPPPNIGFSADVYFTANGSQVTQITRVRSVDLVFHPARGGIFTRALNSLYPPPERNFHTMTIPTTKPEQTQADNPQPQDNPPNNEQLSTPTTPVGAQLASPAEQPTTQLEADRQAVRTILAEHNRQQQLADQAEEARKVRAQMCTYLLDTALSAAKLPAPAAQRVRLQFEGKVFEPAELQAAIDDTRNLVSELTGSSIVQGPARIHSMFSSEDKLQAAVDDLLGAPRQKDAESLQVARLTGIRELYTMLTGDRDFHGGYHPDRVMLATTSDFTGLVKNALNKIIANTWDELGRAGYDWWNRVTTVEHFNTLNTITGTLVGTVGSLPSVSEGAEYTELAIGDSPETADFTKYGGYIPLTLELIDRDETRKLKAYPRELATAGLRKVSSLVAAIFTANAGTGPTMADGGALFNATAVTTSGGHANLLTTALSASQWDTVCTAIYNQPMLIKNASGYYGTGPALAINPRYLLVPRALQLSGMKILYPSLENAANIYSENQQRGQPGDVVTVPEWSDSNNWAAVCDPRLAPAIFVGERHGIMPEIFMSSSENAGAVFTNDEHRLKVRHFLAVWVNDFRPLHKSNVA